jgi:hypothetical protein
MHSRESIAAIFAPAGGVLCGLMARKERSMTSELLKRITALRGINPRLNSVTDQATEIVKSVEKTLVDELKIGVDASEWFLSEPGGEPGVTRDHYLAFDRVGSAGHRIHVWIVTARNTSDENGEAVRTTRLGEERILWPSCSRELKLKAFEKLPELLDKIIKSAESLLQTADETVSKIKEMIGDPELIAVTPPPAAVTPPPEKPGWGRRFGRSRRRVYTVQDAARAHRQYFLDQGVSEAALNTFPPEIWAEIGPNEFASHDQSGTERCSVVFVDEDGSAEVTFADGEAESVSVD